MNSDLQQAFIRGVERLAAWVDLLNAINVFPVADGDTGTNLIVSLTPLRTLDNNNDAVIRKLLFSARGNSGNIAAAFFSGFLTANSAEMLSLTARMGKERAWNAVADPKHGTMLTVFDALADGLDACPFHPQTAEYIIDRLEKAVHGTRDMLPTLKQADVADSGALGMFIYFETFFRHLSGKSDFKPIPEVFSGMLRISPDFQNRIQDSHCITMTVRTDNHRDFIRKIPEYGHHAVISDNADFVKVHLHTDDADTLRKKIGSAGDVIQWSEERIETPVVAAHENSIRIMTDAAGSVTRKDSEQWGMTLLNSYITIGDASVPETYLTPAELYGPMKKGVRVSTSQASVFERHQHYRRVADQYRHVLYLCVGSVFTGNYRTAADWKQKNDPENRMTVMDTQAASGKLGIIALATARYASAANDVTSVVRFAENTIAQSQEYVFPDKLRYLAAGGRLSKTGAFVGDILNMKPVISPTSDGAKKVGAARNQADQIAFAMKKLGQFCPRNSKPFIMAEYSDNKSWVEEAVQPKIRDQYPFAEIILQPLSLTSGAHMGPGTWAIAFLPESGIS